MGYSSQQVEQIVPVAFQKVKELEMEKMFIINKLSTPALGQRERRDLTKRLKQIEARMTKLGNSVGIVKSMMVSNVDGDNPDVVVPIAVVEVKGEGIVKDPAPSSEPQTTSTTATSVDNTGTIVDNSGQKGEVVLTPEAQKALNDSLAKVAKELRNKHFVVGVLTAAAVLGTFHILFKK